MSKTNNGNTKKLAKAVGAVAGGGAGYILAIKAPFVLLATLGLGSVIFAAGVVGSMAGELASDVADENKQQAKASSEN